MSLRAIIINPIVKKGESTDVRIEMYTDEGEPLDLTDYIDPAVFLIAKRWVTTDDSAAIINTECDITDEELGQCKAFLAWADTTNYDEGRYLAEVDLIYEDTNGYEYREKSDTLVMWVKEAIRNA